MTKDEIVEKYGNTVLPKIMSAKEEKDQVLFYDDDKFHHQIKDNVRKEIAEECSSIIASLITQALEHLDISPSTMDDLYDDIMEVIRGGK